MDRKLSQMFVASRYATEILSSSNVSRFSMCDSSRDRVQMFWGFIHENGASFFRGETE